MGLWPRVIKNKSSSVTNCDTIKGLCYKVYLLHQSETLDVQVLSCVNMKGMDD